MKQGICQVRRLLSCLTVVVLLTGCTSGTIAPSTPAAASVAPSASSTPSPAAPTATPEASPSPAVAETSDATYGATGALTEPELLDVYAPTTPGPWPVVVMFHGDPGGVSKGSYAAQARHVAQQGFVVFVPDWGALVGGSSVSVPTPAQFQAYSLEGACAVAFARKHATDYGGDPNSLILFGHSAGANLAGSIAFTRPTPTTGCPAGASLGPIHALVTWDGDWTLTDPSWDAPLAADPSSWETTTPITHITSDKTLKVVVLMSDVVGPYRRDLSDPTTLDGFFDVRDPSGTFRRQLQANGMLNDKSYDIKEIQQLFYSLLKTQGNPVTLTALPGASHGSFGAAMGDKAMSVFVAAFEEAAGD
jgi:acetyl esterase/lipase